MAKINWTASSRDPSAVHVNVPSQAALLADLRRRVEAGQGFAVATLNLDHVVKLRQDPAFRQAYGAQTHITADGRPIVWLSQAAGDPVELVTGSDLVDPMFALCAALSVPVGFVGSTDAVLTRAAEIAQDRHPGLDVVTTIAPPMGFDPASPAADTMMEEMAQADVRVWFLALGAPKQEILAARFLQAYPQMGCLSIGASLDFIAGTQVRAPRLMRALAAEWLWRLMGNPRRLAARYGACFAVLPGLAMQALRSRHQPAGPEREPEQGPEQGAERGHDLS